jgi:hypothetical protein
MAKEDRSGEFIGVLGFFIAICTLLVVLRCYTKAFIVKNFTSDDWFSILTLISFLVFCTMARLGISHGTGKRRYLISDEDYPNGMKVCTPRSGECNVADAPPLVLVGLRTDLCYHQLLLKMQHWYLPVAYCC